MAIHVVYFLKLPSDTPSELSTNYWYGGTQPDGAKRVCVAMTRTGVTTYEWRSYDCSPRGANYICETGRLVRLFLLQYLINIFEK